MSISNTLTAKHQQITSVDLCSIQNISGSYYNGKSNDGVGSTLTVAASSLTIDGVIVVINNRVLLSRQTDSTQNGIYDVTSIGASVVLTRSNDFQCAEQVRLGYYIPVQGGLTLNGFIFVITAQPSKIGADAIVLNTGNKRAGLTPVFAGGATTHDFIIQGFNSNNIVTATVATSTNVAVVTKIVPTTDTLTVSFNVDPGAGTAVYWISSV